MTALTTLRLHLPPTLQATPCEVHTFDCTYDGADLPGSGGRHRYHKTCVGQAGGAGGTASPETTYVTFEELLASMGHSHVDLLKLDIEGRLDAEAAAVLFCTGGTDPQAPLA